MSTHRLRIELPDRPGAPAQVAAVVAEAGADVVSIDLREVEGPVAVDEVVVAADDDWEPGRLRDALERTGVGMLLSAQRVACDAHAARDALASTLRRCTDVVGDLDLGRAILEVTSASAAWVCDVDDAGALPGGARAVAHGRPLVVRTDALPPPYGDTLPRVVWVLAVPDDVCAPSTIAFAANPSSLRFSATDVARVEALLAIRRATVTSP